MDEHAFPPTGFAVALLGSAVRYIKMRGKCKKQAESEMYLYMSLAKYNQVKE